MTRKAKIIATLGNSTEGLLEYIIENGADAVLIDNYYGCTEECDFRINKIKELREKLNKNTAIIYDLDHIYAESKLKRTMFILLVKMMLTLLPAHLLVIWMKLEK